jgi:guanylate kinase
MRKFFPDVADGLTKVVLYNSRSPRPAETDGVDYHFRPRQEIEALREQEDFQVMEVRGDLQALDMGELKKTLSTGDAFFEGNPFVGKALLDVENVEILSVFLSPLSKDEILYLKGPEKKVNLPDFVADVMRRKLLRRTKKQKTILSLKDLENIETRCRSAYSEMKLAHLFEHVIPNHDGEDSENWDAFYYPVGDARKALLAFVDLLQDRTPDHAEKWEQSLLP